MTTAFAYGKNKAGGILVSELVLKIFTCLIWHTPSIKYEHLVVNSQPVKNDLVAQAYKAAESTRFFIIEQQQIFKMNQRSFTNDWI